MPRPSLLAHAVMAALMFCAAAARGEDRSDRSLANQALRSGNERLDAGRCQEAMAQFERARQLFPAAARKIGLNIAGALECLGRYREAIAHLEQFLAEPDPQADAVAMEAVRGRVRSLQNRLARLTVRCLVAGATVVVDGGELGRAPLERSLRVDPGHHRVAAQAAGLAPLQAVVDLRPRETRVLELRWPVQSTEPRPLRSSRRPLYKRWWFWTAVGAVVVGITVGVVASQTGGSNRLPGGELGEVALKP